MTNTLKHNATASNICDNRAHGGKMVGDGPGKAQVRSGLQRIFAQTVTNNPEREDRANKPESIQPPFWRSQPSSCGQQAMKRIILKHRMEMESDGRQHNE